MLALAAMLGAPVPGAFASASELKLATWDLGWLTLRPVGDPVLPAGVGRKPPEDLARLARYAQLLDADIVALQGVDGPDAGSLLFPPERYALHFTSDPIVQRTGFAVRHGIAFMTEPDLATLDLFRSAKLRLRSGALITLAVPGGARLSLLSVHLKSGCRDAPLDAPDKPSCDTLRLQGRALHDWIAGRAEAGEAFIALGDFARVMQPPDMFLGVVAGDVPVTRPTEGQANPCWGGGDFVDHLLAGGPARGWVQPGSLRVMVFRETGSRARERLPAHCPVSVRLHLPD